MSRGGKPVRAYASAAAPQSNDDADVDRGQPADEMLERLTGGMQHISISREGSRSPIGAEPGPVPRTGFWGPTSSSPGPGLGNHRGAPPTRTPSSTPVPRAPMRAEQARHNEECLDFISCLSAEHQLVVVLVGLPGCGKSTFSAQLVAACPQGAWCVACQDVLGSRQQVVTQVQRVLEGTAEGFLGGRIIIDRCNFDKAQRKHWIDLAKEQQRTKPELTTRCMCVVLPNADDESFCADRALARGSDGVHKGDEDWATIVSRMKRDYRPPSIGEGFDAIFWCTGDDEKALIQTVLASAPSLLVP